METIRSIIKTVCEVAIVLIVVVSFILMLAFFVAPAKADVFVYGSVPNYSAVLLPNNSYVHQGENISQGNCYDLSGVYGFSGKLAYWKNEDDAGYEDPDIIIDLEHPEKVCLDASTFPVGRYFQWDGKTCDSSGACSPFGHGNNYVFHVSGAPEQPMVIQEKTIVYTSNITIMQNGSEIQIPVTLTQRQTYLATATPTIGLSGTISVPTPEPEDTVVIVGQPLNMDVQDLNGNPVVGGVAGAIPVTAKAPVSIFIIVFAIFMVCCWGKK